MKISVVTVTYNSEKYLSSAIDSFINQTYTNKELLIVDGGSVDGTIDIINEYSLQIHKFISEPDHGMYDALNKGIHMATGDVIGFLHSDDLYASPYVLEKVAKVFQDQRTHSVFGDLVYVRTTDSEKVIRYWKSSPYSFRKLKTGWIPPHPALFIKRECYLKWGTFDTYFDIAADYDLMLRFLGTNGMSAYYLPEVLIKMRIGGKSNKSLKNILLKSSEDLKALKKNHLGGLYTLFLKNLRKLPQFISQPPIKA